MTAAGVEGERLGSYRLVRAIGRGGMGEVWLAQHVEIKSQVAIKLVLGDPADEEAGTRFLREAKATAKIRHPGIVAVSDYGMRSGGGAYLVMELLDGESLGERLKRGALPVDLAVDLGVQVTEALAAAHAEGIVHRDLKPANVFLVRDAASRSSVRVKLLDFGVAKATGKVTDELGMTVTGALVGTPVYMAPEQCTSRKGPIDHRADLYSLGVVLYEMTTGVPPFRGPTLGDLIDQHINVTPIPPRTLTPAIPSKLDVLIVSLLAKERDDRPATANDVARTLQALRGGPVAPAAEVTMPSGGRALAQGTVDVTLAPGTMATGIASAVSPVSAAETSPPAKRSRLVLALAAAGLAIVASVVTVLVVRRDGGLEHAKATDEQLAAACRDDDGRACLVAADRELRALGVPDLARVYSRVQTACDRKMADGCGRAALMLSTGAGARPDYPRARTLAEQACAADSGRGCDVAGELLWHGTGGPVAQVEGFARWKRGCELGAPGACQSAGTRLLYGMGIPRDEEAARDLYRRAHELATTRCIGDDAHACHVLATLVLRGAIAKPDPLRAADHIRRACELGNGDSCGSLGEFHALGTGVVKDPVIATKFVKQGCERGSMSACTSYGLATTYGLLGPIDVAKGFELVRKACEQGGDRFCGILGNFHQLGTGTPKDLKLAAFHTDRACAAGDADSCASAAGLEGPGVERDRAQLEVLLHRACQLGSSVGCRRLGLRANKRGDHAAALAAFELACAMSDQQISCDDLAGLHIDGLGVPKDAVRGRALLDNACGNGAQAACHGLAIRLRDGAGIPAQPAEALTNFDKACGMGFAKACLAAADMLTKPEHGLTLDATRAATLRKNACSIEANLCEQPPKP